MATIDLGKIKQVWRGTYNNGTAYVVDDLVAYTDTVGGLQNTSTYIAVANTTGNAPASGGSIHASWNLVAQGVPDRIPSQSGQAGKFLTTNGSAVSFGTVTQIIKKIHTFTNSNRHAGSQTITNQFTWTNAFTPLDPANNRFKVEGMIYTDNSAQDFASFGLRFERSGGATSDFYQQGSVYTDNDAANQGNNGYFFDFAGTALDGAGTYTIHHRTYATSSHVGHYNPNSNNNYRNPIQSIAHLMITEYKNA